MEDNSDDDSFLQLALSNAPRLDDDPDNSNTRNLNQTKNNLTISDEDLTDSSENKVADLFSQQIPPNDSDPTIVDTVIASQMTKLSVTDREQVYMDVHGVPEDFVTETPELIHFSLLQLQNELELLSDKRAFDMAERLNYQYVH